jgi:UDP-N-acetyl-D-mannosaminuronate dehydrogenase
LGILPTVPAAEAAGYYPQVILSGRRINDDMSNFIAQCLVKLLIAAERPVKGARIGIVGITFKENVPDLTCATAVSPNCANSALPRW